MKVGDTAPNFILKNENGIEFELYKNLDEKVLLVFYPKDNTLVCTAQLAEYNKNLHEFINNRIRVIGINTGSVQSHSTFCRKLQINFLLLADEQKQVSKLYDALNIFGGNKRLLVLIDSDKTVLWVNSSNRLTYTKSGEIIEAVKTRKIT